MSPVKWTPDRLASKRADYLARRASGRCAWCPCQSRPGKTTCDACFAAVSARRAEKRARKRAERLRERAEQPRRPPAPSRQLVAYRPLDEILAQPATRVLRALRWFDWVSAPDLMLALEIDRNSIDYARHRGALDRLHKAGVVVAQGRQYHITPAGRDELERRMRRAA